VSDEAGHGVRLDKWLWAARFFKTRSNAAAAVTGGKVQLNGARVKPAHRLAPGDRLRIRRDRFEFHVVVRSLASRRGPASEARALYEETEESLRLRAERAAELRAARAAGVRPAGRPDRRGRRALRRLKGGG